MLDFPEVLIYLQDCLVELNDQLSPGDGTGVLTFISKVILIYTDKCLGNLTA